MKAIIRSGVMLVLMLTLALPAGLAGAAPLAVDGPNLLQNPGFESPYSKQCCQTDLSKYYPNTPIDEVQVAAGWLGWWLTPNSDAQHPSNCAGCSSWHRPEWREANCGSVCANRIHSGNNAQKYFTFFSLHDAGMYQQVGGLTPGVTVRFSVYMQGWSTAADYGNSSGQSSMGMRVGIDPFGGTNPFSANIVWTAVNDTYDVWGLYAIEAVAKNSTVTVFTRSTPVFSLQHNDIYVDDASLVVVGGATTPPNNNPPAPAPTVAPTPVPGIQYVVQPGDNYYRIARRFGINVSTLLSANNVTNPNLLYVGTVLIIPGVTGPVANPEPNPSQNPSPNPTVAPTPTQGVPADAVRYTVVVGDNLFRLARRFNTTIARIKQLNGLTSDIIFIGQVLIIAP